MTAEDRIAQLDVEVAAQHERTALLLDQNAQLVAQVRELEARLATWSIRHVHATDGTALARYRAVTAACAWQAFT